MTTKFHDVILSEALARTFRPAYFAGRASAQSKDLRFASEERRFTANHTSLESGTANSETG